VEKWRHSPFDAKRALLFPKATHFGLSFSEHTETKAQPSKHVNHFFPKGMKSKLKCSVKGNEKKKRMGWNVSDTLVFRVMSQQDTPFKNYQKPTVK
jgi:hypothetical protein